MHVSQDYADRTNRDKLELYVRCFRRDLPKRHLWLIPREPGFEGHYLERFLTLFEGEPFANTWLYIMDHRGMGKSSK